MNLATQHSSPLLQGVSAFLSRLDVKSTGMVVAVSGGPDSVALLRALAALPYPGLLIVAHLNHQLRGADSDADEEFVRQLVDALQVKRAGTVRFVSTRIAVAEQARAEGGNLEEVARHVRYGWFAEVARQHGAGFVATGHTANDQAETILHRMIRGAGLKGLRGIAARRPLENGIELVRPLLQVTREKVITYLRDEKQAYREDCSNLDMGFTRNRIRHELLPLLADQYNPAIVSVLCRLAEQAETAYTEVEADAARLLAETEKPRAGELLIFDRSRLAEAPADRLREMFRLVWQREAWPMGAMSFVAWERLAAVARGDQAAADLPASVHAHCLERVVQLGRRL